MAKTAVRLDPTTILLNAYAKRESRREQGLPEWKPWRETAYPYQREPIWCCTNPRCGAGSYQEGLCDRQLPVRVEDGQVVEWETCGAPCIEKDWKVWLFQAGRGCISGDARICDPECGVDREIADLAFLGKPIAVYGIGINGARVVRCDAPFLKGFARLLRIQFEDGTEIRVHPKHGLLSLQGWLCAEQVCEGSLLGCGVSHLQSISDIGLATHVQDALRCDRIIPSCQESCSVCSCLCDGQLRSELDSDQECAPLLSDARERSQSELQVDDRWLLRGHSPRDQQCGPHARSSFSQNGLLQAVSRYQTESLPFAQILGDNLIAGLSRALTYLGRGRDAVRFRANQAFCGFAKCGPWLDLFSCGLEGQLQQKRDFSSEFPCCNQASQQLRECHTPRLHKDDALPEYQLSSSLAYLNDTAWKRVVSITAGELEPFYDIQVPGCNSYLANGVWHHNSGKTKVGAALVNEKAEAFPGIRIGIVGQNAKHVRNTMIEGESGIMACANPSCVPDYEPSKNILTWPNGTIGESFYSEAPYGLRGPQFHFAWPDEISTWDDAHKGDVVDTTWNNLMMATRLKRRGMDGAKIVATSTPRPVKLIQHIRAYHDVHLTHASMFENPSLDEATVKYLWGLYKGTRLERQEIYGELLEDNPHAVWSREWIEQGRVQETPETLVRCVVAVDPAVSDTNESCEHGLVVCALGLDGAGYVLADRTCRGGPEIWSRKAVDLYDEFHADSIVAERNQGGDMVKATIRTVRSNVSVQEVVATRGKAVRAQPIASLYQQGRIKHVGTYKELEDQMCQWDPEISLKQPLDRVDALVWGMTAIMPNIVFGSELKIHRRMGV